MKSQVSIELIVTLTLFVFFLGFFLIKLVKVVRSYEEVNAANNELLNLIHVSETVIDDWIVTNVKCNGFYVKVGNQSCGTPRNITIERYALCNGTEVCKVIVG